jgi:hypothetical protein
MTSPNRFVEKNIMHVREFDRYILEHHEFADKIPKKALRPQRSQSATAAYAPEGAHRV